MPDTNGTEAADRQPVAADAVRGRRFQVGAARAATGFGHPRVACTSLKAAADATCAVLASTGMSRTAAVDEAFGNAATLA